MLFNIAEARIFMNKRLTWAQSRGEWINWLGAAEYSVETQSYWIYTLLVLSLEQRKEQ